jgi:hypothetical protein
MYLWNVQALTNDFIANKVTQEQKFKYYLLASVLLALIIEILINFPAVEDPTLVNGVGSLLIIAITFFGIKWCFAVNAKGDNVEFIDRMTCLGVPITVRILAVYFIVYIVLLATIGMTPELETLSDVLIEAVFFKMLTTQIDKIAKGRVAHG